MAKPSIANYDTPYANGACRWLRGNLHLHTCCGPYADPVASAASYHLQGYDFLVVTDHDRCPEADQWQRWTETAPLLLVPGVECSVPAHILNIGVLSVTEVTGNDYGSNAKALRRQDGFLVGCHPQEYSNGPVLIRQGASWLHAMEVFNGLRALRGCDEAANVALWDELLTAGLRLWAVATDDFHRQYIAPGQGWVAVQMQHEIETPAWQDIVAQLKVGAFYASTGPSFDCFTWDGERLDVVVSPACLIKVIGDHGRVIMQKQGLSLQWQASDSLSYFRVEAHNASGCAWSQPFFRSGKIR